MSDKRECFRCVTVWYKDQWKLAVPVKQGRKWNHYVVIGDFGLRLIKLKDTKEVLEQYLPASGWNLVVIRRGATKGAMNALNNLTRYSSEGVEL